MMANNCIIRGGEYVGKQWDRSILNLTRSFWNKKNIACSIYDSTNA
jgi:hypothetical protein